MATTITFVNGAENVTVNTPERGYTVEVVMGLHFAERADGTIDVWDDGSGYDYRVLQATWLLSDTDNSTFRTWLNDASKGRNEELTLQLGASSTGFHCGGPDKGDVGNFTMQLIDMQEKGILYTPYRHWRCTLTFLLTGFPAYSPPAQVAQGTFSVGTVTNLAEPQEYGFQPSYVRQWRADGTRGGVATHVDAGSGAGYRTTFRQYLNLSNAAALVTYLTGTARGNAFAINANGQRYPFGRGAANEATVTAKLAKRSFQVQHLNYQQFEIDFDLALQAVS